MHNLKAAYSGHFCAAVQSLSTMTASSWVRHTLYVCLGTEGVHVICYSRLLRALQTLAVLCAFPV